jgi:hypothetical protein
MHCSGLILAWLFTTIAPNWQSSAQSPQPMHRSSSIDDTKPEDASMGVPRWWDWIAPQQHEQQLQMA